MTNFVMTNLVNMKFASFLQQRRAELGITIRELAKITAIDQAIISKIETGDRMPTASQMPLLAQAYQVNADKLQILWLAERLLKVVEDEPFAKEAFVVAESRVEYLVSEKKSTAIVLPELIQKRLAELDALKDKWQQCKPLKGAALKRMQAYFNTLYTYESNRIEGNTLTLQETELVVNQGLTIGGKTMVEHLEAINHAYAVEFIAGLVQREEDFSPRVLRELHRIILQGIESEEAGRYRNVPVRISGSRHEPPQPWQLDGLMEDYFRHYATQHGKLHPVILAAEMHERLVSIHPFIDGNGRTSRLVMNLIMVSNGYTLVNLKGDPAARLKYYQSLEAVQVDDRPELFYDLIIDHAMQSLQEHLELV
jgi:Fic family protein